MAERFDVVIIGGGATGTGVVRDLAMRGLGCLLVEKDDLAAGTSGRFHGLLHSGGRYAVKDPHSAVECIRENKIVREIAPQCVEDTGGYFVALKDDDPEYVRLWAEACAQAGIEAEEMSLLEFKKAEPAVNPALQKVYRVPDAAVDGFSLCTANALAAERAGSRVKTYTRLLGFKREDKRIVGVLLKDVRTGREWEAECRLVINAAGAWAAQVGQMAGVHLDIIPDKGALAVFNHRLTSKVLNRLRPPGDGDIFVPHGSVSILGTTSRAVIDPEDNLPSRSEVLKLLAEGVQMIPDLPEMRLIRAFAGVRPLYQEAGSGSGRQATRGFAIIDHGRTDGVAGLVSVVGGKLTTYRLMAQAVSDLAASLLGNDKPCRTHLEPLPDLGIGQGRGQGREKEYLCQCEMVSKEMLEAAAAGREVFSLSDIRRLTRLGMGPCQGTFCTLRAAGFYHDRGRVTAGQANALIREHAEERWKGNRAVLWGEQAQEMELNRGIFLSLLDIDRLGRDGRA